MKTCRTKRDSDLKTLGRLFSYMRDYKGQLVFVVVCILLSAVASAASSLFLQSLIDDYITTFAWNVCSLCSGAFESIAYSDWCQYI